MIKKYIDVCLTPEQIGHFDLKDKIVVVTDILRATSCMVTAMAHEVQAIIPVATLEECQQLQFKGYLGAAERGGEQVEGFELGNSPFQYMNPDLKGKTIAVTTTNGTQAISKSGDAGQIVIGAFLNINAVARYIALTGKDVVIHCAGWKGLFNLEDTTFAGALLGKLSATHESESDSALMAQMLYDQGKNDLVGFIQKSSHAKRLSGFNIDKDIEFCMSMNKYNVVPRLRGREIRIN